MTISLEGIFIKRKHKTTPEKVNAIFWIIRERSYELLEKDIYLSISNNQRLEAVY